MIVLVIYLKRDRSSGVDLQTCNCKTGSDWLKRWVKAQHNISCKVFHDWSMINILEINHVYKMGIYLLHFLKHLTAFVDLDYWFPLYFDIIIQWNLPPM